MFLGYVVSLAGVLWLAVRIPARLFIPCLLLLLSAPAWVSFTSSGLENCWIFLFLILFYQKFFFGEYAKPSDYSLAFLWASLSVVTRLDTALLFLPACSYLLVTGARAYGARFWRGVALAALPILLWFAFSLVYYGFLFPNTYFAKIGLDVDSNVLHQMGAAYLVLGFAQEPITFVTIALGTLLSLFQARTRLAGLSIALYVGYVYSIGGDFIGYRFLAAPFLLSALTVLAFAASKNLARSTPPIASVCVALVLYGALTPASPLRAFRESPAAGDVAYYFPASNLAQWRPGRSFPFARFNAIMSAEHCERLRMRGPRTSVSGGGYEAYCRGPEARIINVSSIADPLLARLVVRVEAPFLPGHVFKSIPQGYVESLESGTNVIADPELAAYFDQLQRVVAAPLFDPARWRAIWELNFTSARRYRAPYPADHSYDRPQPASLVEQNGWRPKGRPR
jgi:arabinofuranosyltransferase